jgi:hypothetical protein
VGKTYQNEEIATSRPAVPETVSVALAELTGELREGLLALAVGTGMACARAEARTRRANRPAIRIRCVLSSCSSSACSRRHHVRNPPGLCPKKYALSTMRSTQS